MSVVLAATHDGALLRRNHAALIGQCFAVGGHVLLADGTREGLPPELDAVVHLPGADVFTLRAAAAGRAVGRVIALTEDHCLVAPDWVQELLRAHEERPEHVAIAGVVENGSTATAVDRANFLLTFAPFLPGGAADPVRPGPAANVSFKRELLDSSRLERPGHLELEMLPHVFASGLLARDDRVRATHVQSHGRLGTVAVHFHNGRSTSGLPGRSPDRTLRAAVRTAVAQVRLPRRTVADVADALRVRDLPLDRATWATLAVLAAAHAVGLAAGVVRGAGSSPRRLE